MSHAIVRSRCGGRILVGTASVVMLSALTCERIEAAGTLFFSSGDIRRASNDGDCHQTIQFIDFGDGVSELDVDAEMGKVYFTYAFPSSIRRCDFDGQQSEVLHSGTFEPLALDIDRINQKLYWTEGSVSPSGNRIMRSNMDGSSVEQLLSGFRVPLGIATDPAGGKIYWTQWISETVSGSIHRANLDGTAHEQIVNVAGQLPVGIAVHHASSKVYWVDGMSGAMAGGIYRANLDGSNVEKILSEVAGLRHLDIDEVGGNLYFGRQGPTPNVFRCDLDGGGFVALGLGDAHGIACLSEDHGFVCFGDTNSDLHVNTADLLNVISAWGPCRSCEVDFNGDGTVNIDDLLYVISHWTT